MPLHHIRQAKRQGKDVRTLAKTKNFEATIESASGYSLEETPRRFRDIMLEEIRKELKRKHMRILLKELVKGENSETYSEEYAKRKTRTLRNTRTLKTMRDVADRVTRQYTQGGPVDFNMSGELFNNLLTRTRRKDDKVTSAIVPGPGRHRNGLTYTALVEELDREKNLRLHALEAVKERKAILIDATVKKSIARAVRRYKRGQ
jgi:hypothetical protein